MALERGLRGAARRAVAVACHAVFVWSHLVVSCVPASTRTACQPPSLCVDATAHSWLKFHACFVARVAQQIGLLEYFRERHKWKLAMLESTGLFDALDAAALNRIAIVAQVVKMNSGEVLQRQGARPSSFYVVCKGVCKVCMWGGRAGLCVAAVAVTRCPRCVCVHVVVDPPLLL